MTPTTDHISDPAPGSTRGGLTAPRRTLPAARPQVPNIQIEERWYSKHVHAIARRQVERARRSPSADKPAPPEA
jgi:hypothetical protein